MKFQPTNKQKGNDLVMTPEYVAEALINYFKPAGKILEPCKGTGNFLKFLPKGTLWCEITEGKDFFDFDEKVDWIITNPPWSQIRMFLLHSMELADNICMLFTLNHLFTKARIKAINENGFGIKEIIMLDTPKEFPHSGFQLGMICLERKYRGPVYYRYLKIKIHG